MERGRCRAPDIGGRIVFRQSKDLAPAVTLVMLGRVGNMSSRVEAA
jgi:hypothetical protein